MTDDPKRPTLFAPCSLELLEAARAEAAERDMKLGGLIRQAVCKYLGLPADFASKPIDATSKKKLARAKRRG